jgi:hypothetical protein
MSQKDFSWLLGMQVTAVLVKDNCIVIKLENSEEVFELKIPQSMFLLLGL